MPKIIVRKTRKESTKVIHSEKYNKYKRELETKLLDINTITLKLIDELKLTKKETRYGRYNIVRDSSHARARRHPTRRSR